jgi:hypothetical protein
MWFVLTTSPPPHTGPAGPGVPRITKQATQYAHMNFIFLHLLQCCCLQCCCQDCYLCQHRMPHSASSPPPPHTHTHLQALQALESPSITKQDGAWPACCDVLIRGAVYFKQEEFVAAALMERARKHEHGPLLAAQAAKYAEEKYNSTQLVSSSAWGPPCASLISLTPHPRPLPLSSAPANSK